MKYWKFHFEKNRNKNNKEYIIAKFIDFLIHVFHLSLLSTRNMEFEFL